MYLYRINPAQVKIPGLLGLDFLDDDFRRVHDQYFYSASYSELG